MSSPVLTAATPLTCAHGGLAEPIVMPSLRVLVSGEPVATLATSYAIAGCPLPPASAPGPCRIGRFISAASRVTAMGQPVLLQSGQSVCVPTGTPMLVLTVRQRVTAL